MDNPLKVYTRAPWTDEIQGLVWTVTHTWYTTISIVTGVSFGLVQQSVERIIVHLLAWICYIGGRGQPKPDQAGEDTALLPDGSPQKSRESCFSQGQGSECCSSKTVARISSWILISFTVAWSVAGAFVTTISADDAALSGSSRCGLWGLKDSANPVAQDEDALLHGQKETRAGQYARDCYGSQSPTSLDQCLLFREQDVPTSEMRTGQQCPFANESYCSSTGATAVRFTTGLVGAIRIGINSNINPHFNRTTICVPLNMESPPGGPGLAEKTSDLPGYWGYNLGPVCSDEYASNYTFKQYGDPFTYDVRSYTMSTYLHVYSMASFQNYWQPIPALKVRSELNAKSEPYSLTLMFINSCRIFYKEASDDPIFPADRKWPNSDLWTNNDSRARPLACIDWIEVCTPGGSCAPSYEDGQDLDESYVFTRYALNKSNAFYSIEFRGATGLDARYKMRDDTSLPLARDPPQWIVESWRLFNTSLSRIQYDALDIAIGTGWDAPLYVPKMPSWARGKMCHMFTFQVPKGYDNIRIGAEVGILLIPLVAWLMGIETSKEFDEETRSSRYFDGLNLIGIEWLFWKVNTRLARRREQGTVPSDQGSHNTDSREQNVDGSVPPERPGNYGSITGRVQSQQSDGSPADKRLGQPDLRDQATEHSEAQTPRVSASDAKQGMPSSTPTTGNENSGSATTESRNPQPSSPQQS